MSLKNAKVVTSESIKETSVSAKGDCACQENGDCACEAMCDCACEAYGDCACAQVY